MTNPIASLLASGYGDALAAAAEGGQSYQFTADGVKGSAPAGADLIALKAALDEAAAFLPGVVTLWCAVSTDKKRIQGEVMLRIRKDGPCVLWDLRTQAVEIKLARSSNATFPSMVEVAQAVVEPELLLAACKEDVASVMEAVTALGYRLDWKPADALSHRVDTVGLAEA